MSKKIWIWNHYATMSYIRRGGRHFSFAENLVSQGYEVTVFCANTSHNSTDVIDTEGKKYAVKTVDNITFVFIKTSVYSNNGLKRIKNMFDFYRNLFPVSREVTKTNGKPEVILASSVHLLTLVAGIKIAERMEIPCICEVRDLWPETLVAYGIIKKGNLLTKLFYKGEKWIYTKADQLIFTMEGGKDYIIEKGWDTDHGGSIDLAKVHHINNGVDLEQFNYNIEHFSFADKDLDNPDLFKVVYTGSIRKANNIAMVLDVAKLITNPKIKFLIWGSGTELAELKKRIIEEHITNVSFQGKVEKKYVPAIVSRADLNFFVLEDSDLFRFGLSLNKSFDYLASGKPLLMVGDAGYSMIDKYACGMHVKNWQIKKFAVAVERLFSLPDGEYQQMCNNALHAAEEYDFKYLTSKLIKVINENCRK